MNYTRRKDGRYQTKVRLPDGTYKTITAPTIKELKQKETTALMEAEKGIDVVTSHDTLKKWYDRFLPTKKATKKEFRTFQHRCGYFLDAIGNMEIRQIKFFHITNLVETLAVENPTTHQPTAKKTLNYYIDAISEVFEFACVGEAISVNPCHYAKKKSCTSDAPVKTRDAITEEQRQWIIDADQTTMKTAAMIMCFGGLRRGEIACLNWKDINLTEKTIRVDKAYSFAEQMIKSTKTEAGDRLVTIPDVLVDYLANLPKSKSMLVCPSPTGKIMCEKTWRWQWHGFMVELDRRYGKRPSGYKEPDNIKDYEFVIDTFTPHQLRHTFATMLAASNVPPIVCKYLMGHKSYVTTEKVYTHIEKTKKTKEIDNLNFMLSSNENNKKTTS